MEERNYFTYENQISQISNIKNLSVIQLMDNTNITPELLESKNYEKIFSNGFFYKNKNPKEFNRDVIYRHKSGFYIYLSKLDIYESSFQIKIYYEQKIYNDVSMFLNFNF